MKRATILTTTLAHLIVFWSYACWGAPPPGSPEALVGKAMNAVNHGRIDEFVGAIDPASLEEFRTAAVSMIDEGAKRVGEAKVLQGFPGVKSIKALKALDAPKLFAGVLRRQLSDPDAKKSLANTKIDVFGHITEGDIAHVVYRSRMKLGEADIARLSVASVRKVDGAWKMLIPEEFSGPGKQGGPGAGAMDFASRRVGPLGNVLADMGSALIVYRMTIPAGDSSLTKLAAMELPARDPAFNAVRADRLPEVKNLLETRLGLRSTTAPAPPEMARRKSAPERPGAVARSMPRAAKSARTKPRTAPPAEADPAASALPEGLADRPATFPGGDRDRFHDLAPTDGLFVGARVSYIMSFGGPKISSIQPIYRVGQKLVNGQRQGTRLGKETTAVAKPGYAVGAINTHTGLTVDGFELVFMKIDGDQLDTVDSYKSPWLGDENGGSPRDASSEGKLPLGLQGRAGKEVYALGLIVRE
jgi:hypothetical protein